MFTVRYSKQSAKTLRTMPKRVAARVQVEILRIAEDPSTCRGDWKRLEGADFWRLRVGGWRAVCDVKNGELLILVLKIAPRGDVYK